MFLKGFWSLWALWAELRIGLKAYLDPIQLFLFKAPYYDFLI